MEDYDELRTIWKENKDIIESNNIGSTKEIIEHGDYGYYINDKKKDKRLFIENRNRIESFCMKHGECSMGVDVNLHDDKYIICGNIIKEYCNANNQLE